MEGEGLGTEAEKVNTAVGNHAMKGNLAATVMSEDAPNKDNNYEEVGDHAAMRTKELFVDNDPEKRSGSRRRLSVTPRPRSLAAGMGAKPLWSTIPTTKASIT